MHNIKDFDFSLSKYLEDLEKNKLEEWRVGLTFNLAPPVSEKMKEFVVSWPRLSILQGCMSILGYSFNARPGKWFEDFFGRLSGGEPPESIPKE